MRNHKVYIKEILQDSHENNEQISKGKDDEEDSQYSEVEDEFDEKGPQVKE